MSAIFDCYTLTGVVTVDPAPVIPGNDIGGSLLIAALAAAAVDGVSAILATVPELSSLEAGDMATRRAMRLARI